MKEHATLRGEATTAAKTRKGDRPEHHFSHAEVAWISDTLSLLPPAVIGLISVDPRSLANLHRDLPPTINGNREREKTGFRSTHARTHAMENLSA